MVELDFLGEPAEFLNRAGDYLAADPVLSTVVATVAQRACAEIADGVPQHEPNWYLLVRDGSDVVGVAMRTAPFRPYPPFLLPMPDEAARALARTLHERGEEVRGVNGALPAARSCAEELARLTGTLVVVAQHTRLFHLPELAPPRPVPGRLRTATIDDLDLTLAWFEAFVRDADEQAGRAPGSMHELAEDRASMLRRIDRGTVWMWEDDRGDVVHLTAVNPPALGVARIGPVYTPPPHRGCGYASATVGELSRRLLDAGVRPCLYTDQANPVSNRIYEALGYRAVVDQANLLIE